MFRRGYWNDGYWNFAAFDERGVESLCGDCKICTSAAEAPLISEHSCRRSSDDLQRFSCSDTDS